MQIKENGSRNAAPNIALTTRHSSQQDLYNRSGSTQHLGTVPFLPEQIKEYRSRHAFPNTTRMHLQTLKCLDQGIRIKECNSKHCPYCTDHKNASPKTKMHRSRNMDQGMQLQTLPKLHRSQEYRSSAVIKEYISRNAFPTQCWTVPAGQVKPGHPQRLEPAARSARYTPHPSIRHFLRAPFHSTSFTRHAVHYNFK
jgi:hypothetical protein